MTPNSDRRTDVEPGYFFIAGAQRCGTTFLYHLLDRHPQVHMARPLRPEPKYFLDPRAESTDLRDYERACFLPPREGRLRGEKSTSYLERPEAARRIQALLPGAKFLFLLRDPVERAISNYWFSVEQGMESFSLDEALTLGDRERDYSSGRFSVSPFAYVRRGRYIEDLEVYRQLFPADSLKLVCFERFVADVDRELAGILGFLGLDPVPPTGRALVAELNHASRGNQALDPRIRRSLAAEFVASNNALAQTFAFDTSAWTSTE